MKTICYIFIMWMLVTANNGQVPQQNHCCGRCRKTFTTGKALGCHLKSHTTLHAMLHSPFACALCHTTFTRRDALTRHQKHAHPVQTGGALGEVLRAEPTCTTRLLARPIVQTAINHACKVSVVGLDNLLRFFTYVLVFFLGAFMDC